MDNKTEQPICTLCANAWRAPQGYVKACTLHLDKTTLEMYGKCVEATVNNSCADFKPREGGKA